MLSTWHVANREAGSQAAPEVLRGHHADNRPARAARRIRVTLFVQSAGPSVSTVSPATAKRQVHSRSLPENRAVPARVAAAVPVQRTRTKPAPECAHVPAKCPCQSFPPSHSAPRSRNGQARQADPSARTVAEPVRPNPSASGTRARQPGRTENDSETSYSFGSRNATRPTPHSPPAPYGAARGRPPRRASSPAPTPGRLTPP